MRWSVILSGFVFIACKSTAIKAQTPPVSAPPRENTVREAPPRKNQTVASLTPSATKTECESVKPVKEVCAPCPVVAPPEKPEVCKAPLTPEVNPPEKPRVTLPLTRPILNSYENAAFIAHATTEYKRYGSAKSVKIHKKKKYGTTVVEQRSGRRRLYDHNIFLRALFDGRLTAEGYGNLREQFEGGLFFDIGSAVLFGEGADTVRDLYEDKKISPKLNIVASDINDPRSKKTMYIKTYRASGNELPFPVVEIPMLMDKPEHFVTPIEPYLKNKETGIIIRSANAGPDLYYDGKQVDRHLKAAINAFNERPVLYFFNKYILYKPANTNSFLILGEIDGEVGTNHKETPWEEIDWKTRTFAEAITLNSQYVRYLRKN